MKIRIDTCLQIFPPDEQVPLYLHESGYWTKDHKLDFLPDLKTAAIMRIFYLKNEYNVPHIETFYIGSSCLLFFKAEGQQIREILWEEEKNVV